MATEDTYSVQTIGVPLKTGSRVTLMKDVDIEDDGTGSTASIMFEDYVERYVPETGLLRFSESDIGRAAFEDMLRDANGIEIMEE